MLERRTGYEERGTDRYIYIERERGREREKRDRQIDRPTEKAREGVRVESNRKG